ncbi:hypothetical protein OCU04_002633 [Sclerotinia nivalis]|uniref:Uncharacterized protein n=1 Tax=Sclerotinia nivalis TaxID=352851 RepID=A0A9X0AU16_9HELO|nr:hypothetical protein OCU04_002633 [Sclerotinia nivalis]
MSEAGTPTCKQRQNLVYTKKDANLEASKTPTKDDGSQGSSHSSQSSKQPLEISEAGSRASPRGRYGWMLVFLSRASSAFPLVKVFILILHIISSAKHHIRKKERMLAGDQFAYDIWHNPREELDESPVNKGCPDCKSLCKCPVVWRWWPGWGGN